MRDFGDPRRRFLKTTTLAAPAVLLSPRESLAQIAEGKPQVEPSATQGESRAADYTLHIKESPSEIGPSESA